jgi:hypothetical protein
MTPVYINIGKYGDKHYYKDKAMTIRHREDAWKIAEKEGQIRRKVSSDGTLYSENLY